MSRDQRDLAILGTLMFLALFLAVGWSVHWWGLWK
jgi:hypothetical protein